MRRRATSMTASTMSNRNPGSTRGRPMPSISVGRVARASRSRVRQPLRERAAGGLGDAQLRAQAAIAQVAADRRRGAAGAGAADDPRRLRMRPPAPAGR